MTPENTVTTDDFNDLRPYEDDEVADALQRISQSPEFKVVLNHLFETQTREAILQKWDRINSVKDFQETVMHPLVWGVVKKSMTSFSWSGFTDLKSTTPYLFVSNHRDIFLDSALLQIVLHKEGLDTSEISFGNNLMSSQLLIDFGKVNKMYTVYRGGNRREKYLNSLRLSAYLRHTIREKKRSLWIAQRDGRTKDGNDQTQPGLIKMLAASGEEGFPERLETLNITPLAISYEYEPCDHFKVQEMYQRLQGPYEKGPGEDLRSIVSGVQDHKGRVHMAVGQPVNRWLDRFDWSDFNEAVRQFTVTFDHEIYRLYKLWPTNYVAWDLLNEADTYRGHYSIQEKNAFESHLEERLKHMEGNQPDLRTMLLQMYAQPLENRLKSGNTNF